MERTPYPKSGRRGCQCADGTYRIDCCDGNSQGIGGLTGGGSSTIVFVDGSEDVYSVSGLSPLSCTGLILTGFSVSDQGVITLPTTNIGTIASTSPASFTSVTEDTSRTLSVTITVPSGYSNATETIVCTTTAIQEAPVLPTLEASDISLSGFAVSAPGVITLPTTDIGTISSTSPASFAVVDVDTLRTLTVNITVPSGYTNSGGTIVKTTTATQPLTATLSCSDITFTGFAVSYDGVITLPSIDIGTISSTSPSSFGDPDVDTLRTLNVSVTVPAGYYNSGSTLSCTTTATQPGSQPALACDDITFTGLAVNFKGAITTPSVDIGTVASISPTSFSGHVTTDTLRTITINVTVPSGYSNSGANLACDQTVTQTAVREFWVKADSLNPTKGYPIDTSSNTCTGAIGEVSSGTAVIKLIHDGSSSIPSNTDRFYAGEDLGGGIYNPVRSSGFTTYGSYLTSTSGYVSCHLTDPATYTQLTSPDFYMYSASSGDGITSTGSCT